MSKPLQHRIQFIKALWYMEERVLEPDEACRVLRSQSNWYAIPLGTHSRDSDFDSQLL